MDDLWDLQATGTIRQSEHLTRDRFVRLSATLGRRGLLAWLLAFSRRADLMGRFPFPVVTQWLTQSRNDPKAELVLSESN